MKQKEQLQNTVRKIQVIKDSKRIRMWFYKNGEGVRYSVKNDNMLSDNRFVG
jgi:hypothetical protein